MDVATFNPGKPAGGWLKKKAAKIAWRISELTVAEKSYTITALLVAVTTLLLVMSIQSVRLQTGYRQLQASSAAAAINVGRVNALIYAIVMESRGIYMSVEHTKVKAFGDELLRRNRELARVMAEWEKSVGPDDAEQFAAFKRRIEQFISFRDELVRRAFDIGPLASREWADNDADRNLRVELNTDLEELERIYNERAISAASVGDRGRYAAWYLFLLGLVALLLAGVNVLVMRESIVGPLTEITKATDLIADGKIDGEIPYTTHGDEIGRLARAVRNFRDAVRRNFELQQLELGTARQRDAALEERDKFNDRYLEAKWQLLAALNNVPQGIIMLDSRATVLAINDRYRRMYGLPPSIKAGSLLAEIVEHRVKTGLFKGNVEKYVAGIVERIAKRQPSSDEIVLSDGRIINIQEQPMDGGGWVATHDDVTGLRQNERILKRTEQFLATVIENIPEAIVAKDARNLRYVFVNKAAEEMIGKPRGEIMGRTARDLFANETAALIEQRDRQLIARKQQLDPIVDTMESPAKGLRTVAVRRLQIGGPGDESHLFVSMIEDRTASAVAA